MMSCFRTFFYLNTIGINKFSFFLIEDFEFVNLIFIFYFVFYFARVIYQHIFIKIFNELFHCKVNISTIPFHSSMKTFFFDFWFIKHFIPLCILSCFIRLLLSIISYSVVFVIMKVYNY